jgi:hypothetical protein
LQQPTKPWSAAETVLIIPFQAVHKGETWCPQLLISGGNSQHCEDQWCIRVHKRGDPRNRDRLSPSIMDNSGAHGNADILSLTEEPRSQFGFRGHSTLFLQVLDDTFSAHLKGITPIWEESWQNWN